MLNRLYNPFLAKYVIVVDLSHKKYIFSISYFCNLFAKCFPQIPMHNDCTTFYYTTILVIHDSSGVNYYSFFNVIFRLSFLNKYLYSNSSAICIKTLIELDNEKVRENDSYLWSHHVGIFLFCVDVIPIFQPCTQLEYRL